MLANPAVGDSDPHLVRAPRVRFAQLLRPLEEKKARPVRGLVALESSFLALRERAPPL